MNLPPSSGLRPERERAWRPRVMGTRSSTERTGREDSAGRQVHRDRQAAGAAQRHHGNEPDFALVVVTHNSVRELERLLQSVARFLDPQPPIVVVDTGSDDDSAATARAHGCTVLELPASAGFGAACNAGVEQVNTAVTVLLNPDCELRDTSLLELVRFAHKHRSLAVPRLVHGDGSVQDSAHPRPATLAAVLGAIAPRPLLPRPLRLRIEPYRTNEPRTVGWAIAACLAAKTDLLRALGPFVADDFLFYEDLDLCLRARRRRIDVWYLPSVTLTHAGGTSVDRAFGERVATLKAARRREVVRRQLGRAALLLDDVCELATYALRLSARALARRATERDRRNLRAHCEAIVRALARQSLPAGDRGGERAGVDRR